MRLQLPTFLYRLYDGTGRLLYIGITDNVRTRMNGHSNTQPWWEAVTRVIVETHPDRVAAETAEWNAILAEKPVFNVQKTRAPRSPKPPGNRTLQRPPAQTIGCRDAGPARTGVPTAPRTGQTTAAGFPTVEEISAAATLAGGAAHATERGGIVIEHGPDRVSTTRAPATDRQAMLAWLAIPAAVRRNLR